MLNAFVIGIKGARLTRLKVALSPLFLGIVTL
jgi:hypothetical protein